MSKKLLNLIRTFWIRLTFRGEPSPERWVFSSVHNRTFNYNSRYLFFYVKEHCPDIQPLFVIDDDKLRRDLSRIYGEEYFTETNTLAGIRRILSCKVWFTSTAPPLYGTGFRRRYVIVNLWHGVPLKKIGMEQDNLSRFTRMYYKYLFADNYEAVLTTSSHLIPVMSRSFLVEPERVKVWGQPRNDCLFEQTDRKAFFERIFRKSAGERELSGEESQEVYPDFEKLILYAPTFRDHQSTRLFPFPEFAGETELAVETESAVKPEYSERQRNTEQLQALKKLTGWLEEHKCNLLIRFHLYDTTGYEWLKDWDRPGSRIRFLNEDRVEDIMEVLGCFDLLITDYSSIYIDYLLTGKPVLFLPYDQEEYLADRGLNFDYDRVTPGPKPKTFQEFLNSMEDLLYNHDGYVRQREKANAFFNEIQKPCCQDICCRIKEIVKRREEKR